MANGNVVVNNVLRKETQVRVECSTNSLHYRCLYPSLAAITLDSVVGFCF